MNKKNQKNQNKKTTSQKANYEDVPTFRSPAKTTGGKIIILTIVAAMVIIPLIALIVSIIIGS